MSSFTGIRNSLRQASYSRSAIARQVSVRGTFCELRSPSTAQMLVRFKDFRCRAFFSIWRLDPSGPVPSSSQSSPHGRRAASGADRRYYASWMLPGGIFADAIRGELSRTSITPCQISDEGTPFLAIRLGRRRTVFRTRRNGQVRREFCVLHRLKESYPHFKFSSHRRWTWSETFQCRSDACSRERFVASALSSSWTGGRAFRRLRPRLGYPVAAVVAETRTDRRLGELRAPHWRVRRRLTAECGGGARLPAHHPLPAVPQEPTSVVSHWSDVNWITDDIYYHTEEHRHFNAPLMRLG